VRVTSLSGADLGLAAVAGLVAGAVNAVAGGGSLLLYPTLVAIGLPSVAANVTNSVSLWPGYAGNVVGLGRIVRDNRNSIRPLTIPAVAGAALGCVLLLVTPAHTFDVIVPFLVLGASALLAVQNKLRSWLPDRHVRHPVALYLSTGVSAVYGGYFGGGLGVILLAVLGLTLGVNLIMANAVKGALSLFINSVTVIIFALFGPVHWVVVAAVGPAALAGGLAGGRFAASVNETLLRRIVVLIGLAVGVWLAVKAFS
jgi:uncharacterized protein